MNYKDISYCENMISSRVKINLILSHVKITMTSYVLSRLPSLIVERASINHLHYDVIRAKPDGSCSRPAETGPSFPGGKASEQY